jgi:flagellar biosynthetic protein FliO
VIKNIANYLKKNFVLTAAVAVCGCALFLCSAGSDSNEIKNNKDINQNQKSRAKQTNGLFSNDNDFTGYSALNGTELFYKIMLAVVFVVALGAAAIFMTKRYLPKIANLQGREIRIVETVHLGPRKSVHILKIGSRRLLIGSTNENISRLADLTEYASDISIQENELH